MVGGAPLKARRDARTLLDASFPASLGWIFWNSS